MGYFYKYQPNVTKKPNLFKRICNYLKEHQMEIAINGMFLSGNTKGACDMYRVLNK
jgi:hypothetical protein